MNKRLEIDIIPRQVAHWNDHERQCLETRQKDALKRFHEICEQELPSVYQGILESAISMGYLILPKKRACKIHTLKAAYVLWCCANAKPTLVIDPRPRSASVCVDFDLSSVSCHNAYGAWNIYQPELDFRDELFSLMMLHARDYTMSDGHVCFRSVAERNSEEVARQLLSFYNRMCKKRLELLKPFLKG